MVQNQVYFFNGDFVGAGPVTKKVDINWLGNLNSAQLVLNFGGKFGWELQYAELNGHKYMPTKTNEIRTGDIKGDLLNGDNTLVVTYAYNAITVLGGDQTTLTASVTIDSAGGITQLPSITQFFQDIVKGIQGATVPTIAILAIIAAIVIAVAVIVFKFGGLGGIV